MQYATSAQQLSLHRAFQIFASKKNILDWIRYEKIVFPWLN